MLVTSFKKSFLFVLLFITGCAVAEISNNEDKISALQAYPRSISTGESIRLNFPQNHPHKIAIRNPSGTWYSVQNSDDNIFVVSDKKYKASTELLLNTFVLEGVTWINGEKTKEKVFIKQGEYLIYMANNLETEPENTFHFMITINLE
ncbi:MAG: hypothetical protein QM484_00755 [Woeseiaceae bacterium]